MNHFYKLEASVLTCGALSDAEQILYAVVSSLAQNHGYCFATNASLSELLAWDDRKVRRCLSGLVEKGFFECSYVNNRDRQIKVLQGGQNCPRGQERPRGQKMTEGGQKCPPKVDKFDQEGGQICPPLYNRESNRKSNRELNRDAHPRDGDFVEFEEVGVDQQPTNQPEPRKEKVAPKRKEVVMPWDSLLFREKWQLWKDYKKKEHRFGFKSEVSEQMALKKLTEVSNGQENRAIELIETAISNGWKGIHEVTQKNQTNGNRTNAAELAYSLANKIASGELDITKG
jgi:hypothetical protein